MPAECENWLRLERNAVRPSCLLANSAWFSASLNQYRRFRSALHDPEDAQRRVLLSILRRNAGTQIGQAKGFKSITSVGEFQRRVPLSCYDDYESKVARIMAGEPGVLTSAPVRRLLPTSGTSDARKLIPYTDDLLGEFNRGISPWIVDLFTRYPSLLSGQAYWSVSPVGAAHEHANTKVPIGFDDDTEYLGRCARRFTDSILAAPSIVRLIDDVAAFRYVTQLFLLRARDLRLISVWHPTFLTLLLQSLPQNWDRLVRDIGQGTLSSPGDVPADVAAKLRGLMRADRRRARELRAIAPDDFATIWPRLAVISAWGDGHSMHYADQLRQAFPHAAIQPKGLVATEGMVTIPLNSLHPVAVRSHFYEFVSDDGAAHLIGDLQAGREYSVVLTTGGGLYRYQLRDRVRVTGQCGRTPSLTFVGKDDGISDRFGEKLSEPFVAQVLRRLFARHRVNPRFAMLAPDCESGRWRYVLHVEIKCSATACDILARDLEQALRQNPHYDYCAWLGQLAPAMISTAPADAIDRYVKEALGRGCRVGDVKLNALDCHSGWAAVFAGDG